MASVARGNEGWPRSAAQRAHARRAQVPARAQSREERASEGERERERKRVEREKGKSAV